MKLPVTAALIGATACGAATDWPATALARIQERPGLVEAFWPASIYAQFWVTVRDDGSERDGLARALCADFETSGLPAGQTVTIRVYDADEMAAGRLRQLATFDCTGGA